MCETLRDIGECVPRDELCERLRDVGECVFRQKLCETLRDIGECVRRDKLCERVRDVGECVRRECILILYLYSTPALGVMPYNILLQCRQVLNARKATSIHAGSGEARTHSFLF